MLSPAAGPVGDGLRRPHQGRQIVNNREIRPFQLYLFIAIVYWLCAYSMSRMARRLEKRTA